MLDVNSAELEDFEPFERFRKAIKVVKPLHLKENDQKIREARRRKERTKQAILEEVEVEE